MIILLLAEARSGSTNLAKWLKESLPDYELLNEPYNPKSNEFIGNSKINTTKNYIISEKYFSNVGLVNELISISDVVICLYREDINSQLESYLTAMKTDNWYGEYIDVILDSSLVIEKDEFIKNKKEFKDLITHNNFKSFTYEGLYYNNQIDELKLYLNIESNISFPYGKKYRINVNKSVI
jgi:hypothetical protein